MAKFNITEDGLLGHYSGKDENIILPDGVKIISAYAFSGNKKIKSITVPESVTEIRGNAFYGCENLESIILPDSIVTIGAAAFSRCIRLKNISLPENIDEIPSFCFYNCKNLSEIKIPDSVKIIGNNAFQNTALTRVKIPEGVTKIQAMTFTNSKLKEIILPSSVCEIGNSAFSVTDIENITVPASVQIIGDGAFNECRNLKDIIFEGEIPQFSGCPFCRCDSLCDDNGNVIINNQFFYTKEKRKLIFPEKVADRQNRCNAMSVEMSKSQKSLDLVVYHNVREITMYDTTEFFAADIQKNRDEIRRFFNNLTLICKSDEDDSILYRQRIDLSNEYFELTDNLIQFSSGKFSEKLPLMDRQFVNFRDIKAKADYAMDRLEYKYNLSEGAKKQFEEFIKKNAEKICLAYIREKDDASVYKLTEYGFFTTRNIQKFIDYTSKHKREILTAFFLNYSHNKFNGDDDEDML